MALEKVTVANTSNQQPLSAQDIIDAQTVLDILRKDGYTGTAQDIVDLINALATVADTGDYNDLINLPSLFSGVWADLTGKPIQAETNSFLPLLVTIDITAKQSYIYRLTGNTDLTIDATNVANNESYVTELRVTTGTGVETLTLLNSTDTKDVYGTFDPTAVNKLVISATKDGSGNVYLTYIFNQPN